MPVYVINSGAPYCLLHYHSFSTHGKDDTLKAIITDEEEAAKQHPAVQTVLREAMTDVLLRMHEYQQTEEKALRTDPLSVLALHAPSSTSNAASMDVSAPTNHQHQQKRGSSSAATEVSSQNSKKLKKDDLWHLGSSGGDRVQAKGDAWCPINDEDENEYLYAAGPVCSQCASAETLVKYDRSMSSMSGTRSEIWGNKDNEGGHSRSTIICKACGFEKVECN